MTRGRQRAAFWKLARRRTHQRGLGHDLAAGLAARRARLGRAARPDAALGLHLTLTVGAPLGADAGACALRTFSRDRRARAGAQTCRRRNPCRDRPPDRRLHRARRSVRPRMSTATSMSMSCRSCGGRCFGRLRERGLAGVLVRDSADRMARILRRRACVAKALTVQLWRAASRAEARAAGFACNDGFAGFSAFDPRADLAVAIRRPISSRRARRHLVMCHPGHVDEALRALDPVTDAREAELRFLLSDQLARAAARGPMRVSRPTRILNSAFNRARAELPPRDPRRDSPMSADETSDQPAGTAAPLRQETAGTIQNHVTTSIVGMVSVIVVIVAALGAGFYNWKRASADLAASHRFLSRTDRARRSAMRSVVATATARAASSRGFWRDGAFSAAAIVVGRRAVGVGPAHRRSAAQRVRRKRPNRRARPDAARAARRVTAGDARSCSPATTKTISSTPPAGRALSSRRRRLRSSRRSRCSCSSPSDASSRRSASSPRAMNRLVAGDLDVPLSGCHAA